MIDRLRDRIRLGRYFGRWSPGDRLPSVREVAAIEGVDRKTVAAAYRRLQQEGLVRVEPRSGVYLEAPRREESRDPLARLHLQWLSNALASAGELGLDPETIHRMFQGVEAVQRRRIPVVDPDTGHAGTLARELSARTGLDCEAVAPGSLPADSGPFMDPPFLVATPKGAASLNVGARGIPRVLLTLDRELLRQLREAAGRGPVDVVVGSETLERDLRSALEAEPATVRERVEVHHAGSNPVGSGDDRRTTLLWPGADGRQGGNGRDVAVATRLVAESTLAEVRAQISRCALEQVNMSSGGARRGSTGGAPPPR